MPSIFWDLSYLARDQTRALGSQIREFESLDSQGISLNNTFYVFFVYLFLTFLCIPFYYQNWLSSWLSGKEFSYQCRRWRFDPWVGKIPWRGKMATHSSILAWKFHEQRSLAGYSPWGLKELDTIELLSTHVRPELKCKKLWLCKICPWCCQLFYNVYRIRQHPIVNWHRFASLCCASSLSRVWVFATTWTVARKAPLSVEFSGQAYWSGLPFATPDDLPNQGSNPGLPHCRRILDWATREAIC